ncbi:hypothetical protein C0966_15705 [Bacillus methanolicus]|nr:hypothetical protein [Bacillus methanolicus]
MGSFHMRYLNLKLENSKFMMIHLKPNSSDPLEHSHGDDFQISIPLFGSTFIDINNKTGILEKQHRFITAPGEKHIHFTDKDEGKVLLINIKKEFLEKVYIERLAGQSNEISFSSMNVGSSDLFIKIAETAVRQNLFGNTNKIEIQQLEWELANLVFSQHEGPHNELWRKEVTLPNHPMLKRAVDFIHEQYNSEITLDQISEESGISKYYFLRLFKEVTGFTPSQYITKVRLDHSLHLLKHTKKDITMIAYEVGFGSLGSFERAFKKRFGINASEFRKK